MAVAPTTTDPAPAIPTPPATPAPAQPTAQDCAAVNSYNWDTRTAYAICMAESRGDPAATGHNTNGTIDRGLMQINSIHSDMVAGDVAALYNPSVNLKIAYSLSKGGTDWTPWSTYNNGKFTQYLQ